MIIEYLLVLFSFFLFSPPIQLHADSEPAQVIQDQTPQIQNEKNRYVI